MLAPFLHGFGTGGGFIVAIGAQNAFVLSQGVRKNHHLLIAFICIVCDVLFISAGVAGVGSAVSGNATLSNCVAIGGALFLFFYGYLSLRSALQGGRLELSEHQQMTTKAAIVATLAVTLLNPHFYLDTVILLGSVSSTFHGSGRLYFWGGAVLASTIWFICLSLGGQLLAPLFHKQIAWRILDSIVCLTMWSIGISLVMDVA